MYVNKIIDPRGPLELASRDELYAYAKANGVKEIDEAMYMGPYAAEKMKKILMAKGLTKLSTVLRPFSAPEGTEEPSGKTMTVDDLVNEPSPAINHKVMSREELAQSILADDVPIKVSEMKRSELAKECKRRGIKMQRTDTKEKLQERLSESHAA